MSSRKPRVTFSEIALRDINDIQLYTDRTWGVEQRRTYRALLRETFQRLASMPSIGKTSDEHVAGLRSYPAGSHVVYYLQRGRSVFVVRVLHYRQDPFAVDWTWASEEPGEET